MLRLIFLLIFSIGFGYFATQNAVHVPLMFGPYIIPSVPLYFVVAGTLVIGLIFAWALSLLRSVSIRMALKAKEKEIESRDATIHTMTKQINDLQIENASLKTQIPGEPLDDTSL